MKTLKKPRVTQVITDITTLQAYKQSTYIYVAETMTTVKNQFVVGLEGCESKRALIDDLAWRKSTVRR